MVEKKFLENLEESAQGTILPVHVIPGSRNFALGRVERQPCCKAARKKGKANRELLERPRDFFNTGVEIAHGGKSRKKRVLVRAPKQELLERLSRI